MTPGNMRANGVRAVIATCEACGREADVNVDALPKTLIVPQVGRSLRCSQCGGKAISARPAWHTVRDSWGRAREPGRRQSASIRKVRPPHRADLVRRAARRGLTKPTSDGSTSIVPAPAG